MIPPAMDSSLYHVFKRLESLNMKGEAYWVRLKMSDGTTVYGPVLTWTQPHYFIEVNHFGTYGDANKPSPIWANPSHVVTFEIEEL